MKDNNIIIEKDNLGIEYRTVVIGNQQWTIDNLSVDRFRNGDIIQEVLPESVQAWNVNKLADNVTDNWNKYFNNNNPCYTYFAASPTNNNHFGKLYNIHVVNDKRGVGPEGFRIPSMADFQKLANYLGDEAGKLLKSKNSSDLNSKSTNWSSCAGTKKGNNKFGFNGVPSGMGMVYANQVFGMVFAADCAIYWTTDSNKLDFAGRTTEYETPCVAELNYGHDDLVIGKLRVYTPEKSCALSIRLVKDVN